MKCVICGNKHHNKNYVARENMFGTNDSFSYVQCKECDCLQITETPENMGQYYENRYYSFQSERVGSLKRFVDKQRAKYYLFNETWSGLLLSKLKPKRDLVALSKIPLNRSSLVLDVGCGSGKLLQLMQNVGMKNLLGIDRYIESSIVYESGLRIDKKTLFEVEQKQDVIMFHHSFEHIAEQIETLVRARSLLTPGGVILIRVPTVSSYAWKHYGVDWVQLDAPRHFFLHSIKSMALLAKNTDLKLVHHHHDSWSFQFTGSEMIKNNHLGQMNKSNCGALQKPVFSKKEIAVYERFSQKLNAIQLGDSVSFYLIAR